MLASPDAPEIVDVGYGQGKSFRLLAEAFRSRRIVALQSAFNNPAPYSPRPPMLPISTIGLMASGCAIVLLMPGPTNTLLAAAGLRQGLRRSAHLCAAELAGYLVSITLWGLCFTHASQSLGWLPKVLRVTSSLYLAWLALRLWFTANSIETSASGVVSTRTLFSATVLNPKAILFAGSIFPSVAFASVITWLQAMAIFAVLLIPIGLTWIAIGAAPRNGRAPFIRPAFFQRCASVVVGAFSVSLMWALAH